MNNFYKDKIILVIGGTGSIGQQLVKRLLDFEPKVIRILSRDEQKQFMMQNDYPNDRRLRFLIGDIREYERVKRASDGVDIIFHLAAMKHVPASEFNPYEAVKTNVLGTQNIITAAIENDVDNVLFTSSDKAVGPTNVMGATKLLAERLIVSANHSKGAKKTSFSCVRFGNVIGSNGSIIPLFKKQILQQNRITITDPEMTRFTMTEAEAAGLVLKSCFLASGGEIFILKMPVFKLDDMIDSVIDVISSKYNVDKGKINKEVIGFRVGEKLYEELMTEDESLNAVELSDMFVVNPSIQNSNKYGKYKKVEIKPYRSDDNGYLSKEEVRKMVENLL